MNYKQLAIYFARENTQKNTHTQKKRERRRKSAESPLNIQYINMESGWGASFLLVGFGYLLVRKNIVHALKVPLKSSSVKKFVLKKLNKTLVHGSSLEVMGRHTSGVDLYAETTPTNPELISTIVKAATMTAATTDLPWHRTGKLTHISVTFTGNNTNGVHIKTKSVMSGVRTNVMDISAFNSANQVIGLASVTKYMPVSSFAAHPFSPGLFSSLPKKRVTAKQFIQDVNEHIKGSSASTFEVYIPRDQFSLDKTLDAGLLADIATCCSIHVLQLNSGRSFENVELIHFDLLYSGTLKPGTTRIMVNWVNPIPNSIPTNQNSTSLCVVDFQSHDFPSIGVRVNLTFDFSKMGT